MIITSPPTAQKQKACFSSESPSQSPSPSFLPLLLAHTGLINSYQSVLVLIGIPTLILIRPTFTDLAYLLLLYNGVGKGGLLVWGKSPFVGDLMFRLFMIGLLLMLVGCVSFGSKELRGCDDLRYAYEIEVMTFIDFLLIRERGVPDRLRLLDFKEVNKILGILTAKDDYIKCLERVRR